MYLSNGKRQSSDQSPKLKTRIIWLTIDQYLLPPVLSRMVEKIVVRIHKFIQPSVVAPTVWNSLPPALRLLPSTLSDTFYNQLKTVLFDRAVVGSTSE